jgi:hypothetical protein
MFQCLDCGYNTANKSNLKRHSLSKHPKIINNNNNIDGNMDNSSGNMDNSSGNMDNSSGNMDNSSGNMDTVLPNDTILNQCEKCQKIYTSKGNLKTHSVICKGIMNKYECEYCHRVLCNSTSKKRHELICKEKGKSLTINNNDNSVTNNTQNNDNTVNNNNTVNNDNSINITVFNANPRKTTKFDTHHITPDVLIQIFKQSMNNNKLLCSKLLDVIWDKVSNRCITKTNMKTQFSKVSGENGSWLSGLDLDIYPKFLKDVFKTSTRLINKYRAELLKLISEDKIDKAYFFLDEMETVEMDDKKKSKMDMDDDNYFYGNSEEDSIRINGFQEIDNERIDEFQRSYKRYKLKAYDNAKLLA